MPGPTPTLVPVPASTPPVLNKSLESYDPGAAASPSNPLLPTPSVGGFSIPTSLPPPHVPSPNAESLALYSDMTPSRPTGNLTLPCLRDRGLVTTGNMCFANAVLQLLVHSPPFWNLIKELGDLNRQSGTGGPETGGGRIPLVDATVRFFEEFTVNEKEPPTEHAAIRKQMENEEEKKENKKLFEPTYMYDAMNEKKQLKSLLVRFRVPHSTLLPLICADNVSRMANSRMQKSFSASISTRLMTSCSRYSLLLVVTSRLLLHPE